MKEIREKIHKINLQLSEIYSDLENDIEVSDLDRETLNTSLDVTAMIIEDIKTAIN